VQEQLCVNQRLITVHLTILCACTNTSRANHFVAELHLFAVSLIYRTSLPNICHLQYILTPVLQNLSHISSVGNRCWGWYNTLCCSFCSPSGIRQPHIALTYLERHLYSVSIPLDVITIPFLLVLGKGVFLKHCFSMQSLYAVRVHSVMSSLATKRKNT